jgi:hypothetical protein
MNGFKNGAQCVVKLINQALSKQLMNNEIFYSYEIVFELCRS